MWRCEGVQRLTASSSRSSGGSESESETHSDSVSSEEAPDGMFGCLWTRLAWHRSGSGCMVPPSTATSPKCNAVMVMIMMTTTEEEMM